MKLGIVITGHEGAEPAVKMLREAAARDHELRCFLTDSGVRAMTEPAMREMVSNEQVTLAVCEHSMDSFEQPVPEDIVGPVVVGGQYQDAELAHWCDRVVVF